MDGPDWSHMPDFDRSRCRQRLRLGPMLPTGMSSAALTSAEDGGGSAMSTLRRDRHPTGRDSKARWIWALRSSARTPESTAAGASSGTSHVGSIGIWRWARRRSRRDSCRAVVASQPPMRSGSRMSSKCSARRNQVVWLTSAASTSSRPRPRAVDQISPANWHTRDSQAPDSSALAAWTSRRIASSVTAETLLRPQAAEKGVPGHPFSYSLGVPVKGEEADDMRIMRSGLVRALTAIAVLGAALIAAGAPIYATT